MECPSCQTPLASDSAKFCAECGHTVKIIDQNIESNALFALPAGSEPDDEFLKFPQPPRVQNTSPPSVSDSKETVEEETPKREDHMTSDQPDLPELPELEEDKSKTENIEPIASPSPAPEKKKNSKLPAPTRLSFFHGIGLLLITLILLCPSALAVYHYDQSLDLRALLSAPFLPLLLWPVLATRGLSLNLVFHLSFYLSTVSFLYLYILTKTSDFYPVFLNLQFQGFDVICTHTLTLLCFTLVLYQVVIFYLFRNESIAVLKIMLGLIMAYALIEVVQALALGRDIPALGGRTNLISHPLTFLGDLALYMAPNYILSNIMLPLFTGSFFLGFVIRLFKRNWQLAFSYFLYASLCFQFSLLYLWPYRIGQALGPSDLDDEIVVYSLAPLLEPCYSLLGFLTSNPL